MLTVAGVSDGVAVDARIARYLALAESRLAERSESGFPEIQAWRRAFSTMGLEATQYRCAAEALLRRLRKHGSLPRIHPLIDVCNAISVAFAIPVAAFDTSEIAGHVEVRNATGTETFETFSGETENPRPGEVIFADASGRAHARRWTNRQSGASAVRGGTTSVLVVAEALHESASDDIASLLAALEDELRAAWSATPEAAILSRSSPRFDVTL